MAPQQLIWRRLILKITGTFLKNIGCSTINLRVSGNRKQPALAMKAVKKFATFDEMKSCESKTIDYASSLKKHQIFEKVIKEIMSINTRKNNRSKSK